MRTITEYAGEIRGLLKHKIAVDLEDAFIKAEVPLEIQQRVREYLGIDVTISEPSILRNSDIDPKTLIKPKPEASWIYTEAYRRYLIDVKHWNPTNIIHSSQRILERFPDVSNEQFTSKGLVIGYVQSGKTASMAALTNLAADHGYKIIIVLAGLLKDLRLQTQNRMDQEVTGSSEAIDKDKLISHSPGTNMWIRLTKAEIDSDFRTGSAQWDASDHNPKIIVMKKLPSIINSLVEWIRNSHMDLKKFPVLIIDDESDHATIDTNYSQVDDEGNPVASSKTNEAIRELVKLFPKCVYVGYTATPFANFFIDAANESDLYPKDFICVLDEPHGYWGARQLFGLGLTSSDLSSEDSHEPTLDLIEIIDSEELRQFNETLDSIPNFLREAIYSFLLTSLARFKRGQDSPKDHFSMLIHPSRLTSEHDLCKAMVEAEINSIKRRLMFPTKPMYKSLHQELKKLWDNKFRHTTQSIQNNDCPDFEFEDIWQFHKNFFNKLEIIALNSNSGEKLDYDSGEQKITIIIGGNKLSRGLTLEGLSTSVFYRNIPDAYDTALQMGRWFGYRKGYFDLTRIFVEETVANAFADLARVELEVRNDLKKYSIEPNPPTPLQIFPLVRAHPAMVVTSRLKLGASRTENISFQGRIAQTVSFPISSIKKLKDNLNLTKAWVKDFNKALTSRNKKTFFYKNIPPTSIIEFLKNYQFGEGAREINSHTLINYISNQLNQKELINWDVILPVGTLKNPSFSWTIGVSTHTVNRSRFLKTRGTGNSIKILYEPPDIKRWREECDRDEFDRTTAGIFIYVIDKDSYKDSPNECLFSSQHERENVLGFAIAFPRSSSNATVTYVTQG